MSKGAYRLQVRNILRNRLNSVIIIICLALGLGAAFTIFSWAAYEYSYDSFNKNKDRIYRVLDHQSFKGQKELYIASVPEYLVNTFENEIPEIELSTILLNTGSFWIEKGRENIEIKDVCYSDDNLFNIFTLNFISGNPKTCLSSIDDAVITKSTADKLFGEENPVGKTIKPEGGQTFVVSAVIKDIPASSHLNFNMLVSIDRRRPQWNRNNGNHNASVYVLLKKGINANDLKDKLRRFTDKHFPWDKQNNFELQLQSLSDIHLNSDYTIWEMNKNKFNKTYVMVLILTAILLLVISSINFFNLTLVSLSKRKTEIGIRKINGSGRLPIIRHFLMENFILAGVASVIAVLIVVLFYPYLQVNFFNGYKFTDIFNFHSIVICLGVLVTIVLVTGIFPSATYTSLPSLSMLSGNIEKRTGRKSFNHTLVVSQLALTTLLIICTLGINKQMRYVRNIDLGVNTDQVLILPAVENIKKNYPVLKEELEKNPHILDVTASNCVIGQDFWRNSIMFEGQDAGSEYTVPYLITDFNFPEFYKMQLIKGRFFSKEFNIDTEGRGFLINESLAVEMGYDDPIGKKMRFGHTQMGEIIGVVKDFHYQSMHKPIEPMAFYVGSNELYNISVRVNRADIGGTLAYIEKEWKSFRPGRSFRYQFLDQEFANLYNNDTKTTRLVLLFTILSIMLSSLGLFGLISFVSEQKTKEIGVRKVNGARIYEIMAMLNKNYVIWGTTGFVFACPVAWYVTHKWLENFAYKTSLSWWIFALAGVLALGIALLTVSWQSWRVATKNPVEALRYE